MKTQDIGYTSIDKRQGIERAEYKIEKYVELSGGTTYKYKGRDESIRIGVINMGGAQRQRDYSVSIQKWIGYVSELSGNRFTAILNDVNNPTTEEIATFDINEDVSEDDIPLIKTGAIFYWSIGYHTQNGQRKKESFIRFKRSVQFTKEDVDKIADNAEQLNRRIRWE